VNQILGSPVISLSNSFNYSLNKKRFDMMKTIITSPYRRLKVLLVLPVFAIVFYAFAKPEYHYTTPARNSDGASDPPEMTVNMQDDLDYQKEIVIRTGDGSELKALFVIDGVVSENGMKKVNPDAILSVSVLKDNAATDKYGEKGRNGVIEITTKPQSPVTPMPISQAVEISQKAVKGIIRKEDGQPLEGVEIMSTGTTGNSYHTTTGKDGRFEINNVPEDASLLFSCRGYKRLTLKADFGKEMTIKMETDPEYKAPAVQRPTPVVAIDGIISEKNFATASKELGYEMGPVKMLPVKEATDKYGEKGAGGVYEITTRTKALEMGIKVPLPRLAPADYPTFQGQPARSFNDWAAGQVSYPPEARAKQIEGWITVNFAVELDGTVTNITPAGQTDPLLSEEVVRVIKNSPKWDPPKNPEVDSPFNSSFTIGFKLPDQVVKTPPYIVVEEMPMYPGGELELLKFIAMNTQYPEAAKAEGIEGRVIVRFIVNTEGNTEGITVLKGVHPLLDNEAIRVVSRMSGFRPGMQDGKAVNVWYMVPITFTLAKPNQP
jgi:TonB family protein